MTVLQTSPGVGEQVQGCVLSEPEQQGRADPGAGEESGGDHQRQCPPQGGPRGCPQAEGEAEGEPTEEPCHCQGKWLLLRCRCGKASGKGCCAT